MAFSATETIPSGWHEQPGRPFMAPTTPEPKTITAISGFGLPDENILLKSPNTVAQNRYNQLEIIIWAIFTERSLYPIFID